MDTTAQMRDTGSSYMVNVKYKYDSNIYSSSTIDNNYSPHRHPQNDRLFFWHFGILI